MPEVLFYHLERASVETVLPDLLEKSLQRGWKAAVRCRSKEQLAALDTLLWTYREDSFLPHGCDDADRQPVYLTDDDHVPEGAQVLFLLGDALEDFAIMHRLERCVAVIDGADPASVEAARLFWKKTKSEGVDATYWKQSPESGRFERQG
jgi:DNA polymerase-3 subunit chi